MKITWVTLSVSDIKKSIAFYTEVFGMQVVSRFHGGIHEIAMLKTKNEVLIELIPVSYTHLKIKLFFVKNGFSFCEIMYR